MKWIKVREKLMALFALLLVVILVAVIGAYMGWNIPGLRQLTDALGIGPE